MYIGYIHSCNIRVAMFFKAETEKSSKQKGKNNNIHNTTQKTKDRVTRTTI
jgi:hypothetical protein